jgi:hypothetical protein
MPQYFFYNAGPAIRRIFFRFATQKSVAGISLLSLPGLQGRAYPIKKCMQKGQSAKIKESNPVFLIIC